MGTVDDVKQRLDIADVVGDYVRLEKSGRNLKARCPFHDEKTPSFFVFPDRQSWKCFGCGAGGDVISFVMKKEGTDFSQALNTLADRVGVSLVRKRPVAEDGSIDRLVQINEAAARYYHRLLLEDTRAGQARDYVHKRGLDRRTIEDFRPAPQLAVPHTKVRPAGDVREFLTAYARVGGPHHLAVCFGDARRKLAQVCRYLDADYVEI